MSLFCLCAACWMTSVSASDGAEISTPLKLNPLTPEEERVIVRKGTEAPFTGEYDKAHAKGTYVCRRCETPLYRSSDKFDSGCGWPSFDDEIPGAVKRIPDADGVRTEIQCARCGAHLGHVFTGEKLTKKDVRHCVNSISLKFVPEAKETKIATTPSETAYFAGGCFWGVEYLFKDIPGILSTRVGYMGGKTSNPTYKEVCSGLTGHIETLEVVFDPKRTTYEAVARRFFEIHDPTQVDQQGPDIGSQYRSEIFYMSPEQKTTSEKLIKILVEKGFQVATKVEKAGPFWPAEEYHQDYYQKNGKHPYCHVYKKRF